MSYKQCFIVFTLFLIVLGRYDFLLATLTPPKPTENRLSSSYQFGFLQSKSNQIASKLTGSLLGVSGNIYIKNDYYLICNLWGAGLKPNHERSEAFKGVGSLGIQALIGQQIFIQGLLGRYIEHIYEAKNHQIEHNQTGWTTGIFLKKQWTINSYLEWGFQSFILAELQQKEPLAWKGYMQGWTTFINILLL